MTIGIRTRLFLTSILITLVTGGTVAAYLSTAMRSDLAARFQNDLVLHSATVALAVEATLDSYETTHAHPLAHRISKGAGARVTIIDPRGVVIGDSDLSEAAVSVLENHNDRPEVIMALADGIGMSRRFSTTTKTSMFYVARRVNLGGEIGIVRLSKPVDKLEDTSAILYAVMILAGVLCIALAVSSSVLSSRLFSRTMRVLLEYARSAAEGRREPLPIRSGDEFGGVASSVQKLAEQLEQRVDELAMERDRFEAILNGMTEAVIALDSSKRVTLVNPAALALLGLGEKPLGRSLLETIRVPELTNLLDNLEMGGEATSEFDLGNGPHRRVLAKAVCRQTGDFVVVLLDVGDLRRLEGLRREFVSNVSHELKTPVSIISANAETLLDGATEDPAMAQRFLNSIMVNSKRLTNLISDLLDISRLEEGKYEMVMTSVPTTLCLRRAAAALETKAIEKGMTIRVETQDILSVMADPKALDQILFNLLDNAVSYTPDRGRVIIRAFEKQGRAVLEVEDNGPGVDPKHRSRLFERFYRVDKGRSRDTGGTGLGLSIVKHLVDAMGGEVGMRPGKTAGSVFWVSLPRG